jgi:hypothetical protein
MRSSPMQAVDGAAGGGGEERGQRAVVEAEGDRERGEPSHGRCRH